MLRKDVVEAVDKGKFHIGVVETIDQNIEILTGISAGKRDKKDAFPQGTVHYMANQKLAEFAEKAGAF